MAVKNEVGRKMTRQEAGRKGGKKVFRERGTAFYREIGRKCGTKVAEERGAEFYREIGRKGGENRGNRTTRNIAMSVRKQSGMGSKSSL